jgi:NAD(P)-dependent dehydrogenase (short-subunit alcohol dehydrogenase family)
MRYVQKVVLVTGCTAGIGEAVLRGMAAEGAVLAFTGRNADVGLSLEKELNTGGCRSMFIQADATNGDDVARSISRVVEAWGRLDVAVNNVGGPGPADRRATGFHEATADGRSTLDYCLMSAILGMKYELIQMLHQGGGVIANTISTAALRSSFRGSLAYPSAKAALIHLTKLAAVHYADVNIRVNVVVPDIMTTRARQARLTEAQTVVANQPMRRTMRPAEVAEAVLWLCSDGASGVTGHAIPSDGAWAANKLTMLGRDRPPCTVPCAESW